MLEAASATAVFAIVYAVERSSEVAVVAVEEPHSQPMNEVEVASFEKQELAVADEVALSH